MKFMSILESRWWGSDYTKKYKNDYNLVFTSSMIGDENVKYEIFTYGDNKKVGEVEFIRAESDEIVYINHKFKAPDKDWLFKLLGIFPELVNNYHHTYDPNREIRTFIVTPISQTEISRLSSDEYRSHCSNVLTNSYRPGFFHGELTFYKFGAY